MRRFFYTLKQAFLQVLRNRAMSVASIFAITAMLLILSIFFILVINVNTAAQTIQQDYDSIEIYLKDDVTKEQANDIIMQVKEEKGVEDAYYKSKEAAMENFRNRWGDNAYLLDSLNENPLPNSVVVMIGDLNYGDQIAKACSQYDGVEDVKYYKDTVDKLLKMTHFVQLAAIIVMIFLIIVSIVVVSNTIKLTVFNRASEISIMKYVGATNWFIRGPFMTEGVIIGVFAALVATVLMGLLYGNVINLIGNQVIAIVSAPLISAGYMIVNMLIIFLVLGASIGAWGSIISMRKFLDA